ncbi:MAG TPA: hypothetical protein VF952_00115 [Chloroflexia bacterium]|jgi:hypothetical protein
MKEVATISFTDVGSKQEAWAIIHVTVEMVGLCLSLEDDGDIEVFLSIKDCRTLAQALEQAVSLAENQQS